MTTMEIGYLTISLGTLSTKRREAWAKAAKEAGKTLSAWVRELADKEAGYKKDKG